MQDSCVRNMVDAVIQDPHKGPLVRDQQALACLNKLRGLRDVLSLHGGGQFNLSEVLRPWDHQDVQRAAGMGWLGFQLARTCLLPCLLREYSLNAMISQNTSKVNSRVLYLLNRSK